MPKINLYKIDSEKEERFLQELREQMESKTTRLIDYILTDGSYEQIETRLFLSENNKEKGVAWNWALRLFEKPEIKIVSSPKAVVTVRINNRLYALTFGHAFYMVDKYCDRDFGFSFARKMEFSEIKTTTLSSPGSLRNKSIHSYIDYSELIFDSGESFAKLKAKVKLPDNFSLFKPLVEAGTSLKFTVEEESIESIIELIYYVENAIENGEEKCKIPVFMRVKNKEQIAELDERLRESIGEELSVINFSEIEIIGTTEVFNSTDYQYKLHYEGHEKEVQSLNNEEVKKFCEEHNLIIKDVILDILVTGYKDGHQIGNNKVKELIDYTDEEATCLLSKGVWYSYNEDYLQYLKDSLYAIECEYHPEYDFNKEVHEKLINIKFLTEANLPEFSGKNEQEIKTSLYRKYYAENAFNQLRVLEDGFKNYDRVCESIEGQPIELMDLYKDGLMCCVKIGNSSGKLCYAVDQALNALRLNKQKQVELPEIKKVVLWFILERTGHIEDENGRPDINKLNMLVLKNKIDEWKKEVLLMGYQPVIYINYRQ